jgi:hypothetical protein
MTSMHRPVPPETRAIEFDRSREPNDFFFVNAIDADGAFIDILEEFADADEAFSFAESLAKASGLPMIIRDDPFT